MLCQELASLPSLRETPQLQRPPQRECPPAAEGFTEDRPLHHAGERGLRSVGVSWGGEGALLSWGGRRLWDAGTGSRARGRPPRPAPRRSSSSQPIRSCRLTMGQHPGSTPSGSSFRHTRARAGDALPAPPPRPSHHSPARRAQHRLRGARDPGRRDTGRPSTLALASARGFSAEAAAGRAGRGRSLRLFQAAPGSAADIGGSAWTQ